MKKREITNNDLEQLFNMVIEQTPLLNEDQVFFLLNELPKSNPGKSGRYFFQNLLNSVIIGTIVLIGIVCTVYFVNQDHHTEKTISTNSHQVNELAPAPIQSIPVKPTVDISKKMVQESAGKDSMLKAPAAATITEPIQAGTNLSVSDIFKHFEKQPQIFSIQANRDTIIVCKEGTSIKIKANSFISEKTGKEISGIVHIEVKEYYKLSDIMLSNLSTRSGNEILETGGMIHIAATSDRENCIIKQGNEIEIGFPYAMKIDDMALFNGEWTNEIINWKLAKTITVDEIRATEEVIVTEEEVVSEVLDNQIVEQMPEFPGGDIALKKYTEQNANYPFSVLKNRIEGTVKVRCTVDNFGFISNIWVVEGLDSSLDKVAVNLVSKMPRWSPGRQGGRAVAVSYTIPVKFTFKDSFFTDEEVRQLKKLEETIKNVKINYQRSNYRVNNEDFKKEFEKKVNDDNFQKTNISEVNRYVFGVSKLGWLNCDRFYSLSGQKTDYSILIDQPENAIVTLIFQRFKSIISGWAESDRITFKNVPLGEKVIIEAIKTVNDQIFLAVQEAEITNKDLKELQFKPVTMDLLKKELDKLNKLN